jgi:hypothetical protein
METRLGANLSDVRIHTDAAAHRAAQAVNAQAFTAGSHIAFQRSQYNPATAAGRHTLAHELTHVLQQRSGPVAGTDAGGGIRVSDPSDQYERAAEAGARRAMAGQAPAARAADGGAHPASPAADTAPVQRRVGFEFELINGKSRVWTVTMRRGEVATRRLKTDSKAALKYLDGADGFSNGTGQHAYLSSDNGNVEYITDPLNDRNEVETAVGAIANFHKSVGNKKKRWPPVRGAGGRHYQVEIDPGPPPGRPQATLGLGLRNIKSLFETLDEWADPEPPTQSHAKRVRTDQGSETELRKRVATQASVDVSSALDEATDILRLMPRPRRITIPRRGRRRAQTVRAVVQRDRALGFIALLLKTAYDAKGDGGVVKDPKYSLSLMPRSDFISILHTMDAETRRWLKTNLATTMNRNAEGKKFLNESVFGPYKDEHGARQVDNPPLTGRRWLKSIFDGATGGKDKISPPPGYESHADAVRRRARPEGIGAMGTDAGLSLLEFRGFTTGGQGLEPVPVDHWLPLALVFSDLVAGVTGNQGFEAPVIESEPEEESDDSPVLPARKKRRTGEN